MFSAHVVAIALVFGKRIFKYLRARLHLVALLCIATLVLVGGAFAFRDQYFVQNVIFHSDEATTLDDPQELRASFAEKAIRGIQDKPLGHGPGTAGLVSIQNKDGGLLTENYYIQIAYEVGLLGFLLFIGLLYLLLENLWQRRKDPAAQALLASFVGIALMNFLLHTWSNEAVACAWFMLAGTTLAVRKTK